MKNGLNLLSFTIPLIAGLIAFGAGYVIQHINF